MLGTWAHMHLEGADPPPKYHWKKHGNLAENNLVLHAWFEEQKVLSLCEDSAVIKE